MLNTSLFSLFLITSALTVATPGPGVLMTLTSSIRYGLHTAVYVILGTATGTVVMAAISSTGLGILIATSPAAYEVIKGLGALYMVYLGVRLFRAKPFSFDLAVKEKEVKISVLQKGSLWLQGVTLQMTNPMLIMFFVSLFSAVYRSRAGFRPTGLPDDSDLFLHCVCDPLRLRVDRVKFQTPAFNSQSRQSHQLCGRCVFSLFGCPSFLRYGA